MNPILDSDFESKMISTLMTNGTTVHFNGEAFLTNTFSMPTLKRKLFGLARVNYH